ncbi:MAG: CapA family protein [Blastocatellia bacterium]|nr:CapA family protein [Blastocatellia bacterium]
MTRLLLSVRRRNRTRIGFCGRIVAVVVIAASFSGLGSAAGEAGPDDAGVVIAIVGDVLLDRGVKAALERRTFDELLSDVAPVLRDADLAVGNLECALSKRGLRSAKPFSFRGDPAHAAALARAGFDAMSLANNHSLDYGRVALSDTITALEGAGIAAIGAGPSRAVAMQARVIERKGVRIALLGYCAMYVEATTPRADAVTISESDLEVFLQEIRAAKSVSDVVIVLPHWGRSGRRCRTRRRSGSRRCSLKLGRPSSPALIRTSFNRSSGGGRALSHGRLGISCSTSGGKARIRVC